MTQVTMDCPKARQHLALFAGRDLEEALSLDLERHLEQCATCQNELMQVRAARERIAVLGAQTAAEMQSVDLWPALRERLAAETRSQSSAAARGGMWPAVRRWIPISIAAAALVVISVRWSMDPMDSVSAPPGVVAVESVNSAAVEAPNLASTPAPQVQIPTGMLRPAGPGDERLRDLSRPWWHEGGAGAPNALVGDSGLR